MMHYTGKNSSLDTCQQFQQTGLIIQFSGLQKQDQSKLPALRKQERD
jgi:hypothetical protein